MSVKFQELDYRETSMGPVSLRRRRPPGLDEDVFEILLGDEFLMTSLFTASETALADLALKDVSGEALDVFVGGLGLGYTARAALKDSRVRSLVVLDALEPVIDWHRQGLLPLSQELTADDRCRFALGDFFARVANRKAGLDPEQPGRKFDVILVDIDHSPAAVLHPAHAAFYSTDGLSGLHDHLTDNGVFALWSNDPPDAGFTSLLADVFAAADAEVVRFENPIQKKESACTVYVARRRKG